MSRLLLSLCGLLKPQNAGMVESLGSRKILL